MPVKKSAANIKPAIKKKQPTPSGPATEKVLIEGSWEVCNQIGGIYTVIRSKVPAVVEKWDKRYCLLGPYFPEIALGEFEEIIWESNYFSQAARRLADFGFEARYGIWLVTGRPQVVLLNLKSAVHKLSEFKYFFWEHYNITIPDSDDMANQACIFGYLSALFLKFLTEEKNTHLKVLAHFHEWQAGAGIPIIRREKLPVSVTFTTHATLLGRYLATGNYGFYDHLIYMDWLAEAQKYNIEARVRMERAAVHGAHCFTTVSEVTSKECFQLLGRKPDVILPNGLNIERFVALHEFQNLHLEYKKLIQKFIMGHFFPSYSFDLDKTLYFFISGRLEHQNKGFDITLEALRRLNLCLREEQSDTTVVFFIITKQPCHSINPEVLQSQAVTEELQNTGDAMLRQVSERLLAEITSKNESTLPLLNNLIDDYWKLRLRRLLATWKTSRLPILVTHNLINNDDEIIQFLRYAGLHNSLEDRVKIVYHPDFISPSSPLFGMDYSQFVRGSHLGVFPSFYEPWGYTPLECVANGIPTVTSDLSGFGDYVLRTMPDHDENGIYVLERKNRSHEKAAQQLADLLYRFSKQSRRERITQRNAVESRSELFDWHNLLVYYDKAYEVSET